MRIHLDTDIGGDPDDLCALAMLLGRSGVRVATRRLSPSSENGLLRFQSDPRGRLVRVVTDVDGEAFRAQWLASVAGSAAPRDRVARSR